MSHTIKVNEKDIPWESRQTLQDLREKYKPDADITVYNGFPVTKDQQINPGDQVCFIKRGECPPHEEMKRLMVARHSPDVYDAISQRTVGIAGAGGLGSSLAIALSRLAIGHITIADFDVVEPSNLNRQQYFINQIGMYKVEALRENLKNVNPYVSITTAKEKVTTRNISAIFSDCDIIAECFDDPASKSELTNYVLREMNVPIITVSGIAGYANADKLICRKIRDRFYMIGDTVSAAQPGRGLMAPKVGIAAHLQANKILELLLNLE